MTLNIRKTIVTALTFLLASQVSAQSVNVYSTRQPDLVKPLFEAFKQDTGISVNVSFLKKGLIEKLLAEGKRSPADLIMTADISMLSGVVEAGVTQAVTSEVLSANLPAQYRDPDGHWFGLTARARIVYASKTRVHPGEITTYEDLVNPKWKGRICTRSGTSAYNLALLSAYAAHHGEAEAEAWLTGIKANLARKPQGNDRAQVKAIWSGECDIAIGNTYYMGEMLMNDDQRVWAEAVRIDFPEFEGDGTHVNLSGMAMTASARNRDSAVKLMEYLSSAKAQALYAEQNYEYPLLEEAEISPLVASWGTFTPDSKPLIEVAKLRPNSLRITERVGFDE